MPNADMPTMRMTFAFASIATGSKFTSSTTFPSIESMEQLVQMGMMEGMRLSSATHSVGSLYPPAIAPMMSKGSRPSATVAGSISSGDCCERSRSHAKNRTNARRCLVV